jgi:CheY-like chemotaxis protein
MPSLPPATNRVLLVEDDLDIRETIGEVLEEEGYAVTLASSGLEALEHLRRSERLPSAILLDLMMPLMNGWQFRDEQKRNPDWASIPLVVTSAHVSTQDAARAMGAQGFLRKPLNIDELLSLLATLCYGKAPGA